jgi:hypothetical protein
LQWKGRLLSSSSSETSLDELEDSDDGRSKSPLHRPFPRARSATPTVLRSRSPSPVLVTRWQKTSFLQRKLKEKIKKKKPARVSGSPPPGRRNIVFSELSRSVKEATTQVTETQDLDVSIVELYFSDS